MRDQLLAAIPDEPVWVELRAALRGAECVVFGAPPNVAVATDDEVFVHGAPPREALERALRHCPDGELVVPRPAAIGLPVAQLRRVVVHLHGGRPLPRAAHGTRRLGNGELGHLDAGLRAEVEDALAHGEVMVTENPSGEPVSFCYAGAVTERWWDVAVDTVEGFQRQGRASAVVRAVFTTQAALGRQAVWQAEVTNEGSVALARHLGFVAVDELYLERVAAVWERLGFEG